MAKCDHLSWVDLLECQAVPLVQNNGRLGHIVSELPNPGLQYPQTIFCLGGRLKYKALPRLCDSRHQGQGHKGVNLRVDNRTLYSMHPRLFADCDLKNLKRHSHEKARVCHQEHLVSVDPAGLDSSVQDLILCRMLFLFTDVICIFADDVGGLGEVMNLIVRWAKIGSSSSLPYSVRPRIIIVVDDKTQSVTHDLLDEQDFFFGIQSENEVIHTAFKGIWISRLPSEDLSSGARYLALGADIKRQLHAAKFDREQNRVMFSAIHQDEFFNLAFDAVLTSPYDVFNFISFARHHNPVDGALISHMVDFLLVSGRTSLPYNAVASHIASTLLLDAYPPGMHLFCPRSVYKTLYKSACYLAHRKAFSTDELATLQCQRVEGHLYSLFSSISSEDLTSAQVHRDNLVPYQKFWGCIRSNKTCLLCIRRSPEHVLSCGHSICDQCSQIFGVASLRQESEYAMPPCLLCGDSKDLTIRLKPKTAAARVLSIDGGGSRGVIPLENLAILQKILGPNLPVYDMLDLTVGCSSGGLIALSGFMLRMEISQCKELFQGLSRKVFSARRNRFLRSWFSDGIYDARPLEDVLKDHYNPSRRMFDSPSSGISAGRVAVIATTIKDGDPFLFTNYNGAAPRAERAYRRLRPNDENEPFMWQVARATAAAPPLFPTVDIPGVGAFQDGGMKRHNNPITLAVSEARHLWPNLPSPDVIISLGTGCEEKDSSEDAPRFRNFLLDGWIPRVYRSFCSSFDGQNTWKDFLGLVDEKGEQNYFRFTLSVPSGLPRMDNTDCMDKLSKLVHANPLGYQGHKEAAASLLATSFFFQLDTKPKYDSGLLHCIGSIRCRGPAREIIECLEQLDPARKEFHKDKINLGVHLTADNICHYCHRYRQPIEFVVRDKEDKITLSLRFQEKPQRLSAFPNNMQWFIEQQGLNTAFGSSNHRSPVEPGCSACERHTLLGKRKQRDI